MKVSPSQLKPGCVLLNDVMGKTTYPIIPKNTVLTEEHINVLKTFLIKTVHVSSKLASGESFSPARIDEKAIESSEMSALEPGTDLSFEAHYLAVVAHFKKHFHLLQHHMPLDVPEIRNLLIPLLKRTGELKKIMYTWHEHVTSEDYIYHHSVGVGLLSAFLAKNMGYMEHEWLQVGLAGALSDAGMARMGHDILHKESALTEEEMNKIKNHPIYSYRLIEKSPYITHATKVAVLQHHEQMDGSGYPLGLTYRKIHPYARIIAVCDTYHAMTNERYFQGKKSPFSVLGVLDKEKFTKLDPEAVHIFIKNMAYLAIGLNVKLSDQSTGEMIFIEDEHPTRPMVKLSETEDIISLRNRPELDIVEISPDHLTISNEA